MRVIASVVIVMAAGGAARAQVEPEPVVAPPPGSMNTPVAPVAPVAGYDDPSLYTQTDTGEVSALAAMQTANPYGRAGTLEVGASAGLVLATGFRSVAFAPTFGGFVADHIRVSGIASVSNFKAGASTTTLWSGLAEAAYHTPLGPHAFWFVAGGAGITYASEMSAGLIVAPRVGANLLVGTHGVLTPSIAYEYTTLDAPMDSEANDVTKAAVGSMIRVNIAYTATW